MDNNNAQAGAQLLILVVELALAIPIIAGWWGIFQKAGKPGWAAIVPIYNLVVMLEIIEKPLWWIVLMLIPCVNIIIIILVYVEVAKVFGKGGGFAAGLILLPFIFFPILGFGDAQYQLRRSHSKAKRRRDEYEDEDDDYHERGRGN